MVDTTLIASWRVRTRTGTVERFELCEQFEALPLAERSEMLAQAIGALVYLAGVAAARADGLTTSPLSDGLVLLDDGPVRIPNLCGGQNFLMAMDVGGAVTLSPGMLSCDPATAADVLEQVGDLAAGLIQQWDVEMASGPRM